MLTKQDEDALAGVIGTALRVSLTPVKAQQAAIEKQHTELLTRIADLERRLAESEGKVKVLESFVLELVAQK